MGLPPFPIRPRKCWCAAEVVLRGDAICDFPCSGDSDTSCGGFDAFDLFGLDGAIPDVDPTLPTTPLEPYYLGCYEDDQDDRVLDGPTTSGSMTLDVRLPMISVVVCASIHPSDRDVLEIVVHSTITY